MKTKQCRYYEIIDGLAYIYDEPYKRYSVAVSIVKASDIAYYRNNFTLAKLWESKQC